MPSFHTHGVRAFLQLRDSATATTGPVNTITTSFPVAESPPIIEWSPMQGMTHPISTTTVLSPARSSPIPFCIVVEFSPEPCSAGRRALPGPNHLKGDVRLEIRIDGMVRGWKIIPQAKIWPKGSRIEFRGSRVGRTEERAFVFTPVTGGDSYQVDTRSSSSSTSMTNSKSSSFVTDVESSALIPFAPPDLPANASHIEILITLGKKHNTLEKYLIFSPVLQEAFYIPPDPAASPFEGLGGAKSASGRVTKRKAVPLLRAKKEVKSSASLGPSHSSPAVTKEENPKEAEESVGIDINTAEWRPVGLARRSQKTAQMREAEFTARIHLVRFWFIIGL